MAKHYYISFNSVDFTEIFPINNPVATKRKEQGTQIWREEIDEIRLPKTTNSTIYATLHSYFIDKTKFDNEIEIEIYSGLITTGTLYWKGLFSISDTNDNFQNTVAVLNPLRINDDYRPILAKAEMQYELDVLTTILEEKRIGYSAKATVGPTWTNGSIGTAFTTFTASAGTITQASGGAGAGYEAYVPINVAVSAGDIILVHVTALTTNTTPTFNVMQGAGVSITTEGAKGIYVGIMGFTISAGSASPRLWLESPPGDTTNTTFTVRRIAAAYDLIDAGELLMTFLDNYINSLFFMGLSYDVVSTFFNNDALPTGAPSTISTFIGANANGNYVTETATNELKYTIIGLLIEWFAVTDKPSFKLSLNDIMSQLREVFQVYWFIDADGKFRVEHEKYFVKQVDDSTPIVLDTEDEIDSLTFKYNKSGIASTEQFSWSQSANQDFVGRNILYNNFETTNNIIEHSANYITTDIKYVVENIDDASNSGLGLYQCNIVTGIAGDDLYEIAIAAGALSSADVSNAAFSWANLHEKYWSWSRMSENATLNAVATTLLSSIRFLEQDNVHFFYSTAIDPYTMITTQLTGGAPIEIQRDLETDFVTLILGYDPYKL